MQHLKKRALILVITLFSYCHAFSSEIITIKLFDGEIIKGKLSLPEKILDIKEIVIFVHGSGPATYMDHRKIGSLEFNYFDLFADELNKRGIAFFTYNRRGVEIGNTAPYYDSIDKVKYKKYLPDTEVRDIGTMITKLKRDKRLKDAKIILLGWSEGTILAAMAADSKKSKVDALLLAGYANENMFELVQWQNSGESSMLAIKKYFDSNNDGKISREEYESNERLPKTVRVSAFKNASFEEMDRNKDSIIDSRDFGIALKERYEGIMDAYKRNDDEWIWNNYFRVTTEWLHAHAKLEANKTRLLRLKIPIYIFQGEDDTNTPVQGVYDIKNSFSKINKTNLQCFTFKGHSHDLNYTDWPAKKIISEGIQKIFDVASDLNK